MTLARFGKSPGSLGYFGLAHNCLGRIPRMRFRRHTASMIWSTTTLQNGSTSTHFRRTKFKLQAQMGPQPSTHESIVLFDDIQSFDLEHRMRIPRHDRCRGWLAVHGWDVSLTFTWAAKHNGCAVSNIFGPCVSLYHSAFHFYLLDAQFSLRPTIEPDAAIGVIWPLRSLCLFELQGTSLNR